MIDINELRRLAQAATPGPWQFWHGWVAANIDNDGGVVVAERPTPSGGKYQAKVDANFKFIAAANPATVIELLDRLEAAEKAVTEAYQRGYSTGREEIEKDVESWKGLAQQFGNEADALRATVRHEADCVEACKAEVETLLARIEVMERQEPVGVLHVGSYYGEELEDWEFEANQCACDKLNEAYVHNPTSLPLYALPGAKGE